MPPLVFCDEGKKLVSLSYLGEDLCGHVGMIHGGLLATLLDEAMGRCCFGALPNKIAVTASLTVNYKSPAPSNGFVLLTAEVVKTEGRKCWVKGKIQVLGEGEEGGKTLAEAEALFIEPRYAKVCVCVYGIFFLFFFFCMMFGGGGARFEKKLIMCRLYQSS